MHGQPWRQWLKDVAYKDRIPEFLSVLEGIGQDQDFTLQDLQERFSNPLLDELLFE